MLERAARLKQIEEEKKDEERATRLKDLLGGNDEEKGVCMCKCMD